MTLENKVQKSELKILVLFMKTEEFGEFSKLRSIWKNLSFEGTFIGSD
jgi:hypothetical protein